MNSSFIHLRASSEYSISRGLLRINEIIARAVKLQMPAIALTDLNNMFGMVKFFKKAEAAGIKPIAGTILTVISEDGFEGEILCLAKNNFGLKALMGLISLAQLQQKNGKITLTFDELGTCAGNVIIIAGGNNSHIFQLSRHQKLSELREELDKFYKVFGQDFCIEIQKVGKEEEDNFIHTILPMASRLGIPVIATNDAMFLQKEDFDIHETKVCINTGKTLNDPNREKLYTPEQFLKSSTEMANLFTEYGAETLLANTYQIALKCNASFVTDEYFLPEYPVPENHDFNSFLSELSNSKLNEIIAPFESGKQVIYQQRLDYELTQIHTTGFSSYFLIVADFIQWSKNNDVPVGPGRGSGAGSLVAFALAITAVDPIEHNLLFERFINPERISMPDFDIDFCMDKRDQVIDYVSKKYGKNAVSQIATFGTMAARAVVRDVARALGKPYALGDRISKMIPFIPGMTLDKAISSQPIFKKMIQDEAEVSEIIDLAFKLEGIARNVGKHAGGIVIAPGSIADFCPTYFDPQSDSTMTQFDKDDVETIGLVKFDFLGLRTLTVIDRALKTINESLRIKNENTLDLYQLSLDDPKVFELLASGRTTAVFQLESTGMRELIRRLKPTKFEEIVALLALYRPGPLESGMHDEFVDRKHGKSKVTYPHELLAPVLSETYGVILYQEQVMQAAQVLAGYSLGQADILRRAMGKKKVEEMEQQRQIFVDGCSANDIKKVTAEKIFDLIEKFAGYGFNKSHSAAYAMLSYQTAYLKTYYPEHFMAAVLSTELGNTDKINTLINECKELKIKVLTPNIETSNKFFNVDHNLAITYGLGAIKGVADSFIDHVLETRKTQSFKDLFDFTKKVNIRLGGKKSIEALTKAGAFDELAPSRSIALACMEDIVREGQKNSTKMAGTSDLFSAMEENFDPYGKYVNVQELSEEDLLNHERDALGFYFSGHPVQAMEGIIQNLRSHSIGEIADQMNKVKIVGLLNSFRQIRDRSNKQVAFVSFDDGTGTMEGIISTDVLEKNHLLLKTNSILVFAGSVEKDDYRSKELNRRMYKMKVASVSSLEGQISQGQRVMLIDTRKLEDDSMRAALSDLKALNGNFWKPGNCKIHLKIAYQGSEAIIELGNEYQLIPSTDNIKLLKRLFGDGAITIN
ncbi:MAG: DNA polymerase III subunit alpha [SAR86 cluster bacterium BACL1 MAG-120823-bin87]|jgi:DNA polymerase III subunit alpha|nr:MAG: DNA polymerase III subunit alpha [SAR86 cluster bacterium BACL1 MAG-120507-bin14]KRO99326.1 MAG: DNA polymerase III subunit alpha [SAR86 cluster bacterium BACL1 MAG-120823-bin87]KRO99785.1 MAG: DNA polymerase III subunit alpha [SAR86 cluster bacterium BACL1 MAG-120813-bin36]KRP16597.1 MAG: DNA polymerase III subunit alpha [SAR86 cluster bacterium BACL1 MAG-121128-bin56]KRP20972.1 MAG: DNA polymerase III subunit alpha [SAR86 cluster bacterium BACL1 MAG-121022-bin58]KRP23587.1 MAG: DNA p